MREIEILGNIAVGPRQSGKSTQLMAEAVKAARSGEQVLMLSFSHSAVAFIRDQIGDIAGIHFKSFNVGSFDELNLYGIHLDRILIDEFMLMPAKLLGELIRFCTFNHIKITLISGKELC